MKESEENTLILQLIMKLKKYVQNAMKKNQFLNFTKEEQFAVFVLIINGKKNIILMKNIGKSLYKWQVILNIIRY